MERNQDGDAIAPLRGGGVPLTPLGMSVQNSRSAPSAGSLQVPYHRQAPRPPFLSAPRRTSTLHLRRIPSSNTLRHVATRQDQPTTPGILELAEPGDDAVESRRRRSRSEPQRPLWLATANTGSYTHSSTDLHEIYPLDGNSVGRNADTAATPGLAPLEAVPLGRLRRASVATMNALGLSRLATNTSEQNQPGIEELYGSDIVDLLDVVDPEISTLYTLNNIQNSLFVPSLGRFINRTPTYNLTSWNPSSQDVIENESEPEEEESRQPRKGSSNSQDADTVTINSALSDTRYAVLPHGASLEGWSESEKAELNDHVRHMLHSRRSRFKRGLRGFGQYIRKPLGFLVTLYATLITLFGLAWVLFLIGWINVGGKQLYVINVIDCVLVVLFAIVGIGLVPWRIRDTYRMIYIAHYHHFTWKLRKKRALPKLQNQNDLPSRRESQVLDDIEAQPAMDVGNDYSHEFSVLTPEQQKKLKYHQTKFAESHTFYKPHQTITHNAFPLRLLVAIVVLLDCHSLFQIALSSCTWAIHYKVRPFALTTVILCCSICCNITAGILISVGDKRTRKKEVVERMARQELTSEAIKKVEKRKRKQAEELARLEEDAEAEAQQAKAEKEKEDVGALVRKSLDWIRKSPDDRRAVVGTGGDRAPRKSFDVRRPTTNSHREFPRRKSDEGTRSKVSK